MNLLVEQNIKRAKKEIGTLFPTSQWDRESLDCTRAQLYKQRDNKSMRVLVVAHCHWPSGAIRLEVYFYVGARQHSLIVATPIKGGARLNLHQHIEKLMNANNQRFGSDGENLFELARKKSFRSEYLEINL